MERNLNAQVMTHLVYNRIILVYSLTVATVVATVFGIALFSQPASAMDWDPQDAPLKIAQISILQQVASNSELVDQDYVYDENSFPTLIGRFIQPLVGVFGSVFFVLVIYAGIMWMSAAGNLERVAKAKKILWTSVVGLLLVIFAYGAVYLIADSLQSGVGIEQTTTSTSP